MDKQSIGTVISTNRKKKGMTQKALAEQLNVTDKAVSKWERDIACPDINTVPKLAEILDVPVESLINLPFAAKETPDSAKGQEKHERSKREESSNHNKPHTESNECGHAREEYRAKMWQLLIKGIIGFIGGFVFVVITTLIDKDDFMLGMALGVGILCAGIPFGWELLTQITGGLYAVGSFPVVILFFCFKLVGAIMIGWVAYPIALMYNAIKAQKKGSKLKIVLSVVLFAFTALILLFIALMIIDSIENKEKQKDMVSTDSYIQTVPAPTTADGQKIALLTDASKLDVTDEVYLAICEKSLERSLELETKDEESGDKILRSSSINAAYFLNVKEPGTEHYDYGDNIKMQNAVMIVTNYRVNIANWTERDEWTVWVYPDFGTDDNGVYTYPETKVYEDGLLAEDINEVYEWICKEYADMDITQLSIPER